jgi:hypothetical protein
MNQLLRFGSLALLAVAIGCGTRVVDGGASQAETTQLTAVIASLTDASQDSAKFSALWVTPPDAATAGKYKGYFYYANGAPSVSGTSAKSKLKLEKPAGTVAGEPEWEFEKVGDTWKIKAAPLP